MEKKIIQVTLSELALDKRGPLDGAEDINLFRFSLSHPAEGIPGVETVKIIEATQELPGAAELATDFDKAMVFKTSLRGSSLLTVEALSVDRDSKGEALLKELFKSVFEAVLGVWTGGFASAYTGAITKSVGESLAGLLDAGEDVDVVGKATFVLDSEHLPGDIELDLKVEKAVVEKEYERVGGGPPARRRRRVTERIAIPAGPNGRVKLKVTTLQD